MEDGGVANAVEGGGGSGAVEDGGGGGGAVEAVRRRPSAMGVRQWRGVALVRTCGKGGSERIDEGRY
uniref:Uncharacterized protein n=1 Tax=Oryza sativa subsp. japonica TaxID=39947 RepID=Q655X6_ORYSJ|nr:hypothetical protein [Oryza sativa Japonica Group]